MAINGQINRQLIIRDDDSGCWNWAGTANPKTGYGKKQWFARTELAHRWVWTMFNGKIPEGLVINHKCRNRKCVNPDHLEVVTQTENCRHGKGCALTKKEAQSILDHKQLRVWGDGAKLARKYGVSTALIHDIWNGRAWKELEPVDF